jgi:protein SCO1/2
MANDENESPLKGIRKFLWKLLILIVLLVAMFASGLLDQIKLVFTPEGARLKTVTMNQGALIDRSFQLTDQRGQTVGHDQYATKNWAVFFGFTHCPDVCPVTLSRLSHMWGQLKNQDRLQVFFITVDPARDTPEVMAGYVKAFDPRIVALTGPDVLIQQVTKNYNAYTRKVQEPGMSDYTMDHSATVYLLRSDGTFAGTIDVNEPDSTALPKLQRLVGDQPPT